MHVARYSSPEELIGGHPALDLVNTVSWRLDASRTVDRVTDPADLARWAALAGVGDGSVVPDPATHARIARLREHLYAVVDAFLAGDAAPADDLAAVRDATASALRHATPTATPPVRFTIQVAEPADLLHALALAAHDLLTGDDVGRLRRCEDDACGWVFVDASRNRSRRWCSSADCGNRDRARRFQERRRAARGPTG